MMKRFPTAIFVVILGAVSSNALKCYLCMYNSADSSGRSCLGPKVDSSYLMKCPNGQNYCSTGVTSGSLFGTKFNTIQRNCTDIPLNQCMDIAGFNTCINTCSSDGCNTGNGSFIVIASFSTTLFCLITALLLF